MSDEIFEKLPEEDRREKALLEANGQVDIFDGGEVINRIMKRFVPAAISSGADVRELGRILNEISLHESMIDCQGNLTEAARSIGMSRSAAMKYLGITQKEWVLKYLGGSNGQ